MEQLHNAALAAIVYSDVDSNIERLKAMHTLMTLANDEEIYDSWINVFPDMPSEEDYVSIASSKDLMEECYNKFCSLIQCNGYL